MRLNENGIGASTYILLEVLYVPTPGIFLAYFSVWAKNDWFFDLSIFTIMLFRSKNFKFSSVSFAPGAGVGFSFSFNDLVSLCTRGTFLNLEISDKLLKQSYLLGGGT